MAEVVGILDDMARASPSEKRPPLKRRMGSGPKAPPVLIFLKSSVNCACVGGTGLPEDVGQARDSA